MTQITLSKGGTKERTVDINSVEIPDLWHIAMRLRNQYDDDSADKVLECWHRCHDMKRHIQESGE